MTSPVPPALFKQAFSQYANGVVVVTTQHAGQYHGVTVSAFCSVSVHPPLLQVCLANQSQSLAALQASGIFAVNMLHAGQRDFGMRFAGLLPDVAQDRFAGLEYTFAPSGSPVLPDVLAWLDCSLWQSVPAGDHTLLIGLVHTVTVAPDAPALLYQHRRWQRSTPLD